jgi:predicted phosphodiesterase
MKVHVLSDLHVEFGPFVPPETDADVVILAGDIHLGLKGIAFAQATFPTKPVIYLAGNHEYYGKAIPHLTEKLRAAAKGSNVSFLDEDSVTIGGTRFLGCTLWTDWNLHGPEESLHAMELARTRMTDFRRIRTSPGFGKLSPRATLALHRRARSWLRARLDEPFDGPTVVVTHHAPSIRSILAEHQADPLSAAYASDVEALMDGSKAKLWVHGHTHHAVDYIVNGTRVRSNQRGYPDEPADGFDPGCIVVA